jgi:hypothetical protein
MFIYLYYINIIIDVGQMTKISFRMENDLYNLITDYAAFIDSDLSKVLRDLLREGLMVKTQAKLFLTWHKRINNRPLKLDKCDKCGTTENLQFYHIDGNINNFNPDNVAFICNGDLRKLQKSIMEYNPREKFIRWFFFEN